MKKRVFNIKTKVALWYTLMAAGMVLVMMLVLFVSITHATNTYYESLLTRAMSDASEQVSYAGGYPRLGARSVGEYDTVSFALLTNENSMWSGMWPGFEAPFEDGSVRRVEGGGHTWLFQDLLLPFAQGDLWLRGYMIQDNMRFMRNALQIRMQLLMPVLLLMSGLGGYLLTSRAFRPVKQMARKADGIAGGKDLSQRFSMLHQTKPDEFDELALTFNHMFDRLEDSFRRERQFTDDASHELRTPITVIRAACDFALEQSDPAEWREALEVIAAKATGMNDMVSQLLQLARMDAGRMTICEEQVHFSRLVCAVAQEAGLACQKDLDLTGVESDVFLKGDELLLMRLCMNLLENAFRYAAQTVSVSLTTTGGHPVLCVGDDGPGMSAEVAQRIFDRFYQAAPDRSSQKPGAGLGLSMAKEIAKLHHAEITVDTAPGDGCRMMVHFF